ncbi:hypothetical protein H0I31_08055 [Tenacibaculum sp. AHE15PA]|uniref:hypothetical protein n=1 Tax=unclassified Tenacibaculum TaxID=2635139 RepID=UPI001C4E9719|nr:MULTISPECIES: hypothetical protein [unclassified Tenacibaculum]QXP74492.1 hypothetical protein H0I30_04915 [Tenacibaculum sp. AHE14PA]QXP75139.1 hypothetical protein H0I31_08055 [Tenacibaculum sp. AHE15PA]
MARQTGIIKLKGTIGGISFYKTSDGHLAREKGGVDASRIANDPAFQRTRENGSEFGRAGKGGKVLRNAIRILLQNAKDKRVVSRLTKDLLAIIKTDTTNDRGLRTLTEGDFNLLLGFEFNLNGKLGTTLFTPFVNAFDRVSGDATLDIAPFSPTLRIAAPSGTTHFKVVMGAAELDFENESSVSENDETAILPYTSADTAAIALTASLTTNSTVDVVQVLGIEFYQEVNGQMYELKNGAYNALSVVTIDTP